MSSESQDTTPHCEFCTDKVLREAGVDEGEFDAIRAYCTLIADEGNQLTTIIYINHLTSDNIDIDIFLSQISILSVIYMQDKNNALNYVRFNVIAPPTVFTNSYYSIPVVYATGAGSILETQPFLCQSLIIRH